MDSSDPPQFEPLGVMYLRWRSKPEIFRNLLQMLMDDNIPPEFRVPRQEEDAVIEKLLERESLGPTGIGEGAAMPHAKHEAVPCFVGAVGFLRDGIPWEGPDKIPVTTVVLCVSPFGNPGVYLKNMADAMRAVRDPQMLTRWRRRMG